MGEKQNQPFQLSFNPSLRVDFQGSRVTSDGGLVLVRELDERLGFSDLIARHLSDSRGNCRWLIFYASRSAKVGHKWGNFGLCWCGPPGVRR